MVQINDWLNALRNDCTIEVISSADLISEVRRKQLTRVRGLTTQGKPIPPMKSNLVTVTIFDPSRMMKIRPIYLLHAIGRITTPPVPNLVALSSTWALIRYLWAFETSNLFRPRPLTLSNIAREIDFHQKVLLSDEVGMGMAYFLMTNCLHTTNVLDVSIALQAPGWNMFKQYSTSPDYLFFNDPKDPVYIVECKGNQSSYDTVLNQLRRGTEQVPSIVFRDGRSSTSLIIATCMFDDKTCAYVIDPADEQDYDNFEFSDDFQKAEKVGPNEWIIKNDEQFAMDSRLISHAKTLIYTGKEEEAVGQLPIEIQEFWIRYAKKPIQSEELQNELGDFVGVKEVFNTIDGFRVELFRGMLKQMVEMFSIPLNDRSEREKRGKERILPPTFYSERFKEVGYLSESEDSTNRAMVQSICRDGTIFQLTITT